jgi:CRISPR-associated endonuclease Csn1
MMSKKILGLDLGTNSIGWALLEETDKQPSNIIDIGVRIFQKAVENGSTPTPKNVKRRNARLARRVIQRRARRKQRMLNYLVSLDLLPKELQKHPQPEIILNSLGDPYRLRARALDHQLGNFELGRVLLHLVQRRGFLSNRKTLLGDMVDDPDVLAILAEDDDTEDNSSERAKEETEFKKDISQLRNTIFESGSRTLGEYLASLDHHDCKRNRSREGGHLKTDRRMYREELEQIWKKQAEFNGQLTDDIKENIEEIIFYQHPLKLRSDRVGKCSLEPGRKRAQMARLEYQNFRYLQDINNLKYFDHYSEKWQELNQQDREKLIDLFESKAKPNFKTDIRNALGLPKGTEFNLDSDNKKLKGNITACEIRSVFPAWDKLDADKRKALVEDLLTINKKSVLKKRLIDHWGMDIQTAINLCLLEFEYDHAGLSLKAINKLLPFVRQGKIYSDARIAAGYGYEQEETKVAEKLPAPLEIANPIVNKALHELRRVINALIKEYGKPDIIRIEMARDLEMNTKKYKAFLKQQTANAKANEEAEGAFREMGLKNPHLMLTKYPSRADKIRYRLWRDQDGRCAYSNKQINLSTLFSPEIDIDHIIPYSQSLDDSYMNKVVCYAGENRYKGQRTPVDAWGGNSERWLQITQSINSWPRNLAAKKNRFYMKENEIMERDFISSQLNDTRYISKVALDYVRQLGVDVSVSKGQTTAWLRHMWGLNSLIGETDQKERTDHRHHAIDAVVVSCVGRRFYTDLVRLAKDLEKSRSGADMKDMNIDPPWEALRTDLNQKLQQLIVSHAAQRGITGALHEETGAGYINGVGTVYRANLDGEFKTTQVKKIVDDNVREIVEKHLAKYGDNSKQAFAEGVTVLHKDGKTPIKRVRIVQAKTTLDKLKKSKFGARDQLGNVFKWMPYGNMHHVEIIRHKETGKYSGVFVTAMEAAQRVRGIGQGKTSMINNHHGAEYEYIMALHINDLVSLDIDGRKKYYRVQLLDSPNKRVNVRAHTASTLSNEHDTFPDRELTIPSLISKGMVLCNLNCISK